MAGAKEAKLSSTPTSGCFRSGYLTIVAEGGGISQILEVVANMAMENCHVS